MQPQEEFVSSRAARFGHTSLDTLLGTVGGFFAASVQKPEGKRAKATVFLTVASTEKCPIVTRVAPDTTRGGERYSRCFLRVMVGRLAEHLDVSIEVMTSSPGELRSESAGTAPPDSQMGHR